MAGSAKRQGGLGAGFKSPQRNYFFNADSNVSCALAMQQPLMQLNNAIFRHPSLISENRALIESI